MATWERYICTSCLRALQRISTRSVTGRSTSTSFTSLARPSSWPSLQRSARFYAHSASIKASKTSELVRRSEQSVKQVLDQHSVASEEQVNQAVQTIETASLDLYHQSNPEKLKTKDADGSPTSAILSLSGKSRSGAAASRSGHARDAEADHLSQLAYKLLKDGHVFISPTAIERYVNIQILLARLDTIPEMFNLYATKPQPQLSKAKSQEVSYNSPSPDAASSAIPTAAANLALDAAIQIRDLPLALSIIGTSFERPAFRKNKFIRKGLPPVAAAALTPLAAWTLAVNMSEIQTGLPQETFTQMAFAGMATYAAAVGTIGYVSLASANDRMKRVTWAIGMPLRERWLREEERAAADRVACAWGFKEAWRWGEEEGENWEMLKEWSGMRGMILDKVSLMEGME